MVLNYPVDETNFRCMMKNIKKILPNPDKFQLREYWNVKEFLYINLLKNWGNSYTSMDRIEI